MSGRFPSFCQVFPDYTVPPFSIYSTTEDEFAARRSTLARLRILVAESNPDVRETMRQVVAATGTGASLSLAANGQDALNLALNIRPHLTMIDMNLRQIDALSLIRHLRRRLPETRNMVLLTDDNKEYRSAAIEAGACAVVAKAALNEDWMSMIICLLQDCQESSDRTQVKLPEIDQYELR